MSTNNPEEQPKADVAKQVVTPTRKYFRPDYTDAPWHPNNKKVKKQSARKAGDGNS
jgi:hypothetical protein